MRTIEKNIINHLSAGAGSHSLSMRDLVEVSESGNIKRVYLWNHNIFSIEYGRVIFSLCGWNTTTTKSRLNALLGHYCNAGITQKNYELFYCHNGVKTPIDSNKRYAIDDAGNIKESV